MVFAYIAFYKGHPEMISDFFRWVGFQKSDITKLKQSLKWVKIGDEWVGRLENSQKHRISFMDGPQQSFLILGKHQHK